MKSPVQRIAERPGQRLRFHAERSVKCSIIRNPVVYLYRRRRREETLIFPLSPCPKCLSLVTSSPTGAIDLRPPAVAGEVDEQAAVAEDLELLPYLVADVAIAGMQALQFAF